VEVPLHSRTRIRGFVRGIPGMMTRGLLFLALVVMGSGPGMLVQTAVASRMYVWWMSKTDCCWSGSDLGLLGHCGSTCCL